MNAIEFGRRVELAKVTTVNKAVQELYGTTEVVVDQDALRAQCRTVGLADKYDDVLGEVEARVERLNANG